MAAFLNGLLGALKGISGGASKAAHGLMGSIEPETSAPDYSTSDLGDFHFGPGLSVQGATPDQAGPVAKKPGFLERWTTPDAETGLSKTDALRQFGARLQDISDGGDRSKEFDAQAKAGMLKTQQAKLSAQIDALFPDDPQMRFLLKTNPEKATAALADVYKSHHEAANVGAGDSRVFGDPAHGGSTYMAPKYGEADGYGYKIGPEGFEWGDQRGKTYGEAETGRHNLQTEANDRGQLGVAQGNLGVARGHLGVARERLNFDRAGGAGGAGGDAGGGGIDHMSTEQLLALLRNAQ
jgi:hypothetical protein